MARKSPIFVGLRWLENPIEIDGGFSSAIGERAKKNAVDETA